ncbi:putative chromatin regulator PHD family [Rosa chinensis]|uniref:RING-type E3 ubiquitin transferase n=1 Tax=Rosa chinensis TaxID=74649 RepID=A0A2P6QK58_ROSCH|nr:RING-H2 finger protein ATL63 [Rosa chinensis]PRQ34564.1 putative chromatin regulator PHD family [Rosa chinensis]
MFSFNPTETPNQTTTTTTNPLKHLFDTIFSYNGNVMLAALVSLLLVILFVLLLHVYAKWFLAQAHHRRRGSMAVSRRVLGPNRFQHFHTFTFDLTTNNLTTNTPKGLDSSTIATIPLFVYKSEEEHFHQHVECVICLSPFEDDDVGRCLPKCGHCFHVECIDMWLHSHMSCPICRAPVVAPAQSDQVKPEVVGEESAAEAVVIEVSDSGYVENNHDGVEETSADSLSDESSSSPLIVGCSLKRMLSRNRPESKVFPSTNGNDVSV